MPGEARAAGAGWLGVATPAEALALREAGDDGPLLAWLYGVEEDLSPLVAASVDVSAQSVDQISRLVAAAATTERQARVHLKLDTGLSRNGAAAADWPEVCALAAEAEEAGALEVVGVWSHLAAADELGHPSVPRPASPPSSAATRSPGPPAWSRPCATWPTRPAPWCVPEARLDLVRVGIAAYGIDPAPGVAAAAGVSLRPVMSLRSQLVNVKGIDAGTGVSYGLTWTADRPTTVGLVPLGYGDGVPRHAGNRAEVGWSGGRAPIRGRVCMDQFVVELGPDAYAEAGAEVVLFGSGADGEPTAADWADWCDTIGYEIVTRIGARVPRVYRGASETG